MASTPSIQTRQLFATPLFRQVLPDAGVLNAELSRIILERAMAHPGQRKSNAGGWQSTEDMHKWPGDAIKVLVSRAAEMVNFATNEIMREHRASGEISWHLMMWSNVNRTGDYNLPHVHPGSTWSGVYYVDPGDPPPADDPLAGAICFENPNLGTSMSFFGTTMPSIVDIRPGPGLMLLFPSYLAHLVRPYRGVRQRISVAFNVVKTPYP